MKDNKKIHFWEVSMKSTVDPLHSGTGNSGKNKTKQNKKTKKKNQNMFHVEV